MFGSKLLRLVLLISLLVLPLMSHAEELSAQVTWSQRVILSSPVSGTVAEVLVDAGQRLTKGEAMLRLSAARFEAALGDTKAQVKDKKAALDEAEREKQRAEELYEQTVLSDRDLQLAKNQFVSAQAVYQRALALMVNAKEDLKESVIRAPFDGVVIARFVEVGQTIVSRTEVEKMFSYAGTEQYHARGEVSSDNARALKLGQTLDLSIAGKRYNGTIKLIGLEPITGKDGFYYLDVSFKSDDKNLRAGQSAIINLP